jgi:hypothetical protein
MAVIMSSVSAYYYLRVVWYMYFREAPEGSEVEAEPESSQVGVIAAVSLAAARPRQSASPSGSCRGRGQAAHCSSTSPRASPSSSGMPWNGCRQYQVTMMVTGAALVRSRLPRKAVFSRFR